MKEKTALELEKIDCYETLTIGLINDFFKNQPPKVVEPEKKRITAMIRRMFRAEKDYLSQNPEDYFELYSE